ncbi:MAG: hypothetical protein SVR04_15530 [Spirochaetota bacterium]|jgi:hypothetical protein|nr:hypothetical protein [Spirochaetota bacterium]
MEKKVTIKVNGKKLAINKFVHDVTANIVTGLVEPLHDAEADGKIEITVEPIRPRSHGSTAV